MIATLAALAFAVVFIGVRQGREHREESLRTYLVSLSEASGDELAVAELVENVEISSTRSKEEFWTGLSLGQSEAVVRAPVHFRYYVRISERFTVSATDEVVVITAPRVRLFHPPSVVTSGLQTTIADSWFSASGGQLRDAAIASLTSQATLVGNSPQTLDLARRAAAGAISRFASAWLLREGLGQRAVVVRFAEQAERDH
ncbi:MAG: hypothetical protein H0W72_04755 [Planctomycetes bacterium]|nr:hypothetical protein [Planctomycetota bacterium]